MIYQASTAPLTRAELNEIPCYEYINQEVTESDLQQFDTWFMQLRAKPEVYSRWQKQRASFVVELQSKSVVVDWRVYRTWDNTFHLRYTHLIEELGFNSAQRFFHPDQQFQIAKLMDQGRRPIPLAECHIETKH